MNTFEKSVVGIARADQALNKANMIIGAVAFIGAIVVFGIIVTSISKANKKQQAANQNQQNQNQENATA